MIQRGSQNADGGRILARKIVEQARVELLVAPAERGVRRRWDEVRDVAPGEIDRRGRRRRLSAQDRRPAGSGCAADSVLVDPGVVERGGQPLERSG